MTVLTVSISCFSVTTVEKQDIFILSGINMFYTIFLILYLAEI